MPTFDAILNGFTTLFVIIDPIGVLPMFLALTIGMSQADSRKIAIRGVVIATILLLLSALGGKAVLSAMGITIPAFRIAGGLLLFYTAFEMVFEKRQERQEKTTERAVTKDEITNIAVFPLALPLLSGPGAMSATILLAGNMGHTWEGMGVLFAIILSIMGLTLITFFAGNRLQKFLGVTARTILTRLFGVLLAALSVQFVADGVLSLAG